MNKFSLMFVAFVFLGGVVAGDAGVAGKASQVDVAKETVPAAARVEPTQTPVAQTVAETQAAPVMTVAQQETPKAVVVSQETQQPVETPKEETPAVSATETVNKVPAPAPNEKDKEALAISITDKFKLFLGGFLVNAQKAGSVVKYYVLGDVLTDWLSKKGYIATPDAGLINAYVNGVTPRRLVNCAAVVLLVSAAYCGYKAFLSQNEDEDDFFLDEEEDLY